MRLAHTSQTPCVALGRWRAPNDAQGNPQGHQMSCHTIRVGAVGVGVHCNALAHEVCLDKWSPIHLISDQLALAMGLSDFDRDLIEQTGEF